MSCLIKESNKSLEHAQAQLRIKEKIPEVHLEFSFPQVGRIADCIWLEKKIVFEIQCSLISIEEIKKRNSDYEKMGFHVIWLLHERSFNGKRKTPAEKFLASSTHYFTNVNKLGMGIFYDQHSTGYLGEKKSEPYEIDLSCPKFHFLTKHVPKERKKWKIAFSGDLFHRRFWKLSLKENFLANVIKIVYVHLLERFTS